ncbi:MAG TPA: hypothetical protein VGJ66_05030 [Pyrinomonadaceae bacterium]|jgi:hypothetical protein
MATKKAAKSAKSAAVVRPKTLTVASRPGAKLPTIVRDLEVALGKVGCRGCRSGIDKIIIGDPVMGAVK